MNTSPKGIAKAILAVILGGGLGSQLPDIGADPATTQWISGIATAVIALVSLFVRAPKDDKD
jgi:hypothetical protein